MASVIRARYTMILDEYEQTSTRNPTTGQMTRTWEYLREVDCQARGVISEGIRTIGSSQDFRSANRSYTDEDWVKVRTPKPLSRHSVVHNIRQRHTEETAWLDADEEPMYFDVMGTQPIIDPFGRITEYESTLFRKQDGLEDINAKS